MKVDIKNAQGYEISKDSLDIDDAINQRSTASFTVLDPEAKLHFNQGNPIEISDYSNEINISNNYNPLYDTKARISYIKGKSIETINLLETDVIDMYMNMANSYEIIPMLENQTLSFSSSLEIGVESEIRVAIAFYDKYVDISNIDYNNYSTINGYLDVMPIISKTQVLNYQTPQNTKYGVLVAKYYQNSYKLNDIMLNIGTVATPYDPYFTGIKSVTPTIQGIPLGKTLRGTETVYDEYKNGIVNRRCVEVNLWEYGDISLNVTYDNTYRFVFFNFETTYKLPNNTYGSDNYMINSFRRLPSILDERGIYFVTSDDELYFHIEKSIIDDIIAQGTITYEWKKQYSVIVPPDQYVIPVEESCADGYTGIDNPDGITRTCTLGGSTTWYDVDPLEVQWSVTEPSADSGFRWVATGNEIYETSKVEALLIYLEAEQIQGVFELAKYTEEYVKPIIFDMTYEQPLVIDSIDTTIKALIDYKLYFSGFIDDSDEKTLRGTKAIDNPLKEQMTHNIDCKDNHYLADKRLIAKSYINMFCGDIVKDIISSKLADEFVIEGTIQQGEFMEEVVFNYIYINKALEKLAEASGFIWYIDYERNLDFMARDTVRNTINITEADCASVRVSLGNQEYRNNQYIKGGKALTDPRIDTFKSDGAIKNFTVAFPVGEKPSITIDVTPISSTDIGIRGVDEDKKWYWSKDSNIINQDESEPFILAGTDVRVNYKGLFDIVVATPDLAEIDKRSELESNSGIVEQIEEELDNNSITISLNSAIAKLNKYAVDGKVITIKTRRKDLESGQIIHAIFPNHDIDEDVLIYSINVTTEENVVVWHETTLIVGPEVTSFYKMFEKIQSSTTRIIRENIDELQALVVSFGFSKTWLEADTANIFKELYPSETLYPSTTLYPMFEPNDRVKYMEILNGTTVVERVYRIKQTTETNEIVTLFYIKNNQANGTITSLKFYGGSSATDVIDSGVLIGTQTFNYTKTMLEILTISKKDIKGW